MAITSRPAPAAEGHDIERGADAERVVEQPGQLANRHPVTQRNRKLPDKRGIRRIEQVALDLLPPDRVRPVADDHVHTVTGGGAHAVGHRVDVGVDARPDVLQIHHEDVDASKHLRGRFARFAVERVHRQLTPRIARVRRLDHVVLQIRSQAMLRTEERGDGDVGILDKAVGRVPEGAVD